MLRKKNDKKISKNKKEKIIFRPKTTSEIIRKLFIGYDRETGILQLDEKHFSLCFEYSDISFSAANYEDQENIFLKWVNFLHTFNYEDHIQVIHFGIPIKSTYYKKELIFDENKMDGNELKIAKEFNTLINNVVGNKDIILNETRQIVITIEANSINEAKDMFFEYQLRIEDKFKELGSSIRVVNTEERLENIYNTFNSNILEDNIFCNDLENKLTIYDILAPKQMVSFKEKNNIKINNNKYVRVLYVSKLSTSVTPRFYNQITSLTLKNSNIITTLNITPIDPVKVIRMIDKKISGMKTERLGKVKRATKNNYPYEVVCDYKLEDSIHDAEQLRIALQKKKQKLFTYNMLICIQADGLEMLNEVTKKIKSIANEHLISIQTADWQQLEALKNCLPLGWNTLQFKRSLTSEALGVNVPFNAKDLIQNNSIFYGVNLISGNAIFADRKKLLNGNGCVLATSGAGKSFSVKLMLEQVLLRYPNDDIVVIDPQGEYMPLIRAFNGQVVNISTTTDTYINPFDSIVKCNNLLDERSLNDKIEFSLAFIESLISSKELSGEQKTIVARCTKNIFNDFYIHNYDKVYEPDLKSFYEELKKQPEKEAKNLALIIERYVSGGMDIFAKRTNVKINNRFICFNISELPPSIQNAGYLVTLEHIMNRVKKNRENGNHTWIFIDEFHILLSNTYSAEYVAKIYKTGRKENAIPTIITQNIQDVLASIEGCKIISNSEFAIILKQKVLDLTAICKIFNISEEESQFIIDSKAGQGLLVYGENKIPFKNQIPESFFTYQLNQTTDIVREEIERSK